MGKVQENAYKIEDIHNLVWLRNNSYTQSINFHDDENVFFMFDYYDFLKERILEEDVKGYIALCGTSRMRMDNKVSSRKAMGIYSWEKNDKPRSNLFDVNSTSTLPFLGIVQVYIIDLLEEKQGKEFDFQNVRTQLASYKEKLTESLGKSLENVENFRVFQTVTSEDFCIVIRAKSARKIYEAVTNVMKIKNDQGRRIFFTYTNVGIGCLSRKGDSEKERDYAFIGLEDEIVKENSELQFAVRFRAETKVLKEFQEVVNTNKESKKLQVEAVNGLFGRYDLVIRIGMDEFVQLFPFLCKNRAGQEIENLGENIEKYSALVQSVIHAMKNGTIKLVNTRILMDLSTISGKGDEEIRTWLDDSERASRVKERSETIENMYEDFKRKYEYRFLLVKNRYTDLVTMLNRVLYAYENLAYELDTHFNWYFCSQYLEEMFHCMNDFMEHTERDDEKAINKFLGEFQMFVNAFEKFINLLQGVNQNTFHAPQYDVIAPIDGQKFLIAYSEYINGMHESYCNYNWSGVSNSFVCKEKRGRAKAIIYPEVTETEIEITEVIQYDKVTKKCGEANESGTSILICMIPVFEYFERIYDMVPLVSHEICHQQLIIQRELRNTYLIEKIFDEISKEIAYLMQIEAVNQRHTLKYDTLAKLFSECLAEVLISDYKNYYREKWGKFVSYHISQSIKNYMENFLREGSIWKRFATGNVSWETIAREFHRIIDEVSGENSEEEFTLLKEIIDGYLESKETGFMCETYQENIKKLYDVLKQKVDKFAPDEQAKIEEDFRGMNFKDIDICLAQKYNDYVSKYSEHKHVMKYYVGLVIRLYILYVDALMYQTNAEQKESERLCEELASKVQERFRNEFLNGDQYGILDEGKMERVAYWELFASNSKKHYQETLLNIDLCDINEIIDRTVTLYRETCADLIMCKWLGFTSFGYFRMAVSLWSRRKGYTKDMQDGQLLKERLTIVLAVLLREESGCSDGKNEYDILDASTLVLSVKKYIIAEMSYAKDRISKSIDDKFKEDEQEVKELQKRIEKVFFEMLDLHIQNALDYIESGREIVWKDGIWDDVCDDKNSQFFDEIKNKSGSNVDNRLKKCFQKEINLYRRIFWIMDALGRVQKDGKLFVDKKMMGHMQCVYENAIKCDNLHPVVEEVSKFYNEPASGNKTNREKMKDMLSFVQDYYYCNRFRMMWEENE